jgi:hypothetical protein
MLPVHRETDRITYPERDAVKTPAATLIAAVATLFAAAGTAEAHWGHYGGFSPGYGRVYGSVRPYHGSRFSGGFSSFNSGFGGLGYGGYGGYGVRTFSYGTTGPLGTWGYGYSYPGYFNYGYPLGYGGYGNYGYGGYAYPGYYSRPGSLSFFVN